MTTETRLLFGPIAAAVFLFGILGLSSLLRGYSHLHQDISTIGRVGSPMRIPFAIVLAFYACSLLIFASAIFSAARGPGTSRLAAYFVGFYAVTQVGIAIFATPDPLHNIFGIASTVGFLAPLALALSWRGYRAARTLVLISYALGFTLLASVIANLSELYPESRLWQLVKPLPGLVQRSTVIPWLAWLVVSGFLMRQLVRNGSRIVSPPDRR